MKKSLSKSEYVYIASMLFGMFFGAGNLIFPVYMGQMAGRNMWPALIGFIITGVGLPLLGALGYTPGTTDATALGALALVYAALPCTLKLAAIAALGWFAKASERTSE